MPLEILTVPCRTDNYAFLIHNPDTDETALVDAPELAPIEAALEKHGWTLTDLLITHHHYDHVEAVQPLRQTYNCKVIGARADVERLPRLDHGVEDGDTLTICGAQCQVMDVSGHTLGHLAFYFPSSDAVFTADSLMALGCGRLFEGTPEQMWTSLSKLKALPPETMVYSGHEYTQANAKFALTIEPDNAALISRVEQIADLRRQNIPTVPSRLSDELETNPFLRADLPVVQDAIHMKEQGAAQVFAEIRRQKDNF
ncbi:hydroxyacylglutathione hydrolase [Pseudaestuariivita rosea]|uniref:hydroxyacylglutathione hydrolase n=1 Tax=Pseudaestuariivita rosea TaxID=2763263 RepID=UPI001ABAD42A|nr:hydroxyacylglutathione hydrolase [Pseudaestuariivita rosea]